MTDSTIDAISPAPPEALAREWRLIRRITPIWLTAIAMLGFVSLCVVAAEAGADDLRSAHSLQMDRVTALEGALQAQQLRDARAAIQLDDLRARAAAQLEELASSEGFLK